MRKQIKTAIIKWHVSRASFFEVLVFLDRYLFATIKHYITFYYRCPDITRLYTLSETSVNGVPLYVLEFTDRPGKHELSKFLLFLLIQNFSNGQLIKNSKIYINFICSGTWDEIYCKHARKWSSWSWASLTSCWSFVWSL